MYRYDNRVVITLDAGGTNLVFGAMQANKFIVDPITLPSNADNLDKCLATMVEGFRQIMARVPEKPVAISFAFPGPADYPNGIIGGYLPNFPSFRDGVALGPFLEAKFGIPVFINNDGDLFAFGEALGGALPELHLPLPGTEPNAFIVVCATVPEDRYVDIDLGISVQSMLLQATEIGLNGIAIGAFDRPAVRQALALELEPLLLVAVGRGAEQIELVPAHADESLAYYRRDGIHYVPKLQLEELLLGNREAETARAQAAESPEVPVTHPVRHE